MKTNNTKLKNIIIQESSNVRMDRVADLIAYAGDNPKQWDEDRMIVRYGEDVVNTAKKLAPQVGKFEKSVSTLLKKVRAEKLYPLYLEVMNARRGYGGMHGRVTFGDVVTLIANMHNIK